ncbi:MAG TPA: pentapeptide repeat-containing protein [Candidatus Cybelea sp.]|nr:pentapeptide repeat-containing protein [Candidatus Cybelea sp.]
MIAIAATVLNALWQDALLVVVVWLVLHAWPRINAATRYAVWIVTLLAALIVPIATTLAFFASSPPRAVTTAGQGVARTNSSRAVIEPQQRYQHETRTIGSPGAMVSLPTRLRVTLPLPIALAVFGAWALLAGYAAIGLLVGLARLERLKRDALPLPVEYRDSMPQWSAANKGRRPVRLCVSEAIDVPVAVGLFDAMILIPQSLLERLSPAEVEQISLHELAHLRRGDDWSNCLQRVIVAALGWNPAAIFIGAQLELEREVACDDWVLASVGAVRPYAMCLTKMAETAAWPHHPMPAPGVFTTRKQISLRIERLLATGRDIATTLAIGPAAAAVAAVGALAVVIAFVAPSVAAPVSVEPVASIPAVTAAPAVPKRTIATPTPRVKIVRVAVPIAPLVRVTAMPAVVVPSLKRVVKELSVAASQLAATQSGGKSCIGCDLRGVNWAGRDLHGANYTGVDFSRANLAGVNLSGSMLNGADFTKANLSSASFRSAQLTGCDFSQANLEGADFTNARISECEFTAANLAGSQLRDVLDGCKGCDFSRANLAGLNLTGVRINGDDFSHADLRNVNFAGAELIGSDLSNARLDGANLAGAVLNSCDLDGVDLRRVDLSKTKMIDMDIPQRNAPP